MRHRLRAWRAKLADLSVSTAALVISAAVSVALIARLLLRGAGKSVSVGSHIGYTVVIVGVCAGLWVFLLMAADWCVARIASARSYVAGHRRRAVRIGLLVGAVPIMIALLYWVSVARRAGTPGLATGARVAAEVLGACGLSGGTVFLTLRPYLVGPRAGRRVRRFAAGASAWLTCGILLIALRVGTPGWVLVGVFGILMYGWLLFSDHRGMAGDGDFFRCYTGMAYATVGALLWLHVMSLTTLARWAGETALAVLTGAIASGVVWRRLRRAGRGLSRFAFAGATTVLAYVLFLLFDDQMLGGPLEAPLLVLMLWLSVRLWRWMSDEDRRLAVGAGADVVFALTLGSVLVVSLAWLANVLDLPPVEVGVLRDIASSVGQSAEIAPWIWGLVYGLLTAAYLTAAFGVRRSRALVRRMESARLTPAVAAARRTSTVLGIGLMLMAFLGLAAPPAVGPVLSHRIRERYTVAAQDRLTADDAVAVYQAIAQQLARSPANVAVLIEMFEDIHKQHPPTHGGDQPTSGELALSLRMGELQGRAAAVEQAASDPSDPVTDGRPDAEAAAEQSTDQQLARPLQDVSDLETRLAEEQGARERAEESREQEKTSAELAGATVVNLLDAVSLGQGELLAMVREYLDGLAEPPLGELFHAWATRALARVTPRRPPEAAAALVPDPVALNQAAQAQLGLDRAANGDFTFPDVAPSTPGIDALIATAVQSEDQAITVEQQHAQCPDCSRPGEPGEEEHIPVE